MNIKNAFEQYNQTLTDGQEKLLEKLEIFLEDQTNCLMVSGYAGTGKTFMMLGLTDFLEKSGRSFVLMAPTGRAAKVISQRTSKRAATIHKKIYANDTLHEFESKEKEDSETYKFFYKIRNNEDNPNTVYIVDEASMISDMYNEDEFFRFGSGFLLQDLCDYIGFNHNQPHKKLIFIGDDSQLPPVNMNVSPALNESYMREKCGLSVLSHQLTDVVRQKEGSGILKNATSIRNSLRTAIFNKLDIDTSFDDVIAISHENLQEVYSRESNNKVNEDLIIITYSNSTANSYNEIVRQQLFPSFRTITRGDRIIITSNNYNYEIELMNGDFGYVTEVAHSNETREVNLKQKKPNGDIQQKKIKLVFRDITLRIKDTSNTEQEVKCKILENLLHSNERALTSDESKALYIDFKIRNPHTAENPTLLKEAIRSDKYFNALRVKFGYAITCHKAQGGEWNKVIVNCNTSMGYFNSSYFRWLYTAITRSKETLFTIDEPHFRIDNNLIAVNNITNNQNQKVFLLNDNELINTVDSNIEIKNENLKLIFHAVLYLIKGDNVKISGLNHKDYHDIYSIHKNDVQVKIKIYYKSDYTISSVQSMSANEPTQEIIEKIKTLVNKKVVLQSKNPISHKEQVNISFPFNQQYLAEFYENLKNKAAVRDICITEVVHNSYHEIYKFEKHGLVATYKFHYNQAGRFTRFEVITSRTTGLTDEINDFLQL